MSDRTFSCRVVEEISCRRQAKSWAWFLDIDGTLLDLAPSPDSVVVPPELSAALSRIAQAPNHRVALVSGRASSDIHRLFGHIAVSSSGNHGAEYLDGAAHWVHESTREFLAEHDRIKEVLAPFPSLFPGTLTEDKTYSFSLHYRHVPRELHQSLAETLAAALQGIPHIQILPAKLCWEIRPAPGPTKADAVRTLYARFQKVLPSPTLAVVMGDDRTDEDAFAAVEGAVTVHVGPGPTAARYRLPSPAAARLFLECLSRHPSGLASC